MERLLQAHFSLRPVVVQLASAAALVDLHFGTDFKIMGFGPSWFDRIATFVVFTVTTYACVLCLTALVYAFTHVVVLQSQDEILESWQAVATTAFILLLVCSFAYNAHHRHSAEPASDAYEDLD